MYDHDSKVFGGRDHAAVPGGDDQKSATPAQDTFLIAPLLKQKTLMPRWGEGLEEEEGGENRKGAEEANALQIRVRMGEVFEGGGGFRRAGRFSEEGELSEDGDVFGGG